MTAGTRVQTITYPDGEVVTYHYNAAGQVERLTRNKQGRQSVIGDRIGYDKEGHTVYTELGNGTETTYTYDKQRERLQVMKLTADGQTVMENEYRYDAVLGRWMCVDPLADRYPNISPYTYCANNPMFYIDPTGMYIEEGSLKEWNRRKSDVTSQRDYLQKQVDKLIANAEAKGWSSEKLAGKIGNKAERLASLNSSIGTMETLEGSTQVYSLSHTGYGENGGVTLNTSTNVIDIKFGSTANFVHEMTHAGQFETGDVAFTNTGMSLLQDVYDETAAYKAQFGYSPSSVSGLTSTSVANSFGAITPAWVQGLKDAIGSTPYAVGGSANTGLIPVNINSTRDALIQAYPWNAVKFRGLPANYNIRTLQGIYYKR